MSLSADPTFTVATAVGNVYGGTGGASLALSASVTSNAFYVGVAGQSGAQGTTTTGSALGGRLQVLDAAGTVAATAGLTVAVLSTSDGTNYDTVPYTGGTIASVASATASQSWDLPPGQYKVKFTNLDATNAVTVTATLGTLA